MAILVILESPSKATTVKGYLGSNYKVMASVGHVRDLPKSTLGVDIENNFAAHYINIRGKGDLIKELRREAKNATKVYLATDPDREGEAISWHLAATLGIPEEQVQRVTFNEITKNVVKSSIKQPRPLDMDLVNAQQTRRILDRIVGYKLSPFLWKTVKSGLSAGRVQSVATKIIVDRENEIRAFDPKEYWTIDAMLEKDGKSFTARFYGDVSGKKIKLSCESDAMKIVSAVTGAPFEVASVKRSNKKKHPAPPFTTSTLLQEASRKLGFQSQRIMRVAQELYEGVSLGSELGGMQGLITYMRTDSVRVSAEAQDAARSLIAEKYGDRYVPATARNYKTESSAQDAHEAIRPAKISLDPARIRKMLTPDQYKLYKLIWERFIASQMESADLATLTVDFNAKGYIFRTSGYTVTFPGYMAVYEEAADDSRRAPLADEPEEQKDLRMPPLSEGDELKSGDILPAQHYTEPPPRYTEASLTKYLKEKGIGRPSTFATIITTIISRGYVKRESKSLVPTDLGEITTDIMSKQFPTIVDEKFTANMETSLDDIEHGKKTMEAVLTEFWGGFEKQLGEAQSVMDKLSVTLPVETAGIVCDKCGAEMIIKNGRFGKFAACPNYPKCRNTKPLTPPAPEKAAETEVEAEPQKTRKPVETAPDDMKCEKCGGPMVLRTGRYGSFYACANYPQCKYTKPKMKDIGVPCPECGSKMVMKVGRNKTVFYSCEKYPTCGFSSWDLPLTDKCPQCGKMLFRKKGKPLMVCHDKACGYQCEIAPTQEPSIEEL